MKHPRPEQRNGSCCEFPEFTRLNYSYGQMLGARDFETEQAYHRQKHLLHNRCLHGWGVICGLLVTEAEPAPDPGAQQQDSKQPTNPPRCPRSITVGVGMGIDPCGNDLIVGRPCTFELPESYKEDCLYLCIRYCEQDIERIPVHDSCSNPCAYAKKRELVAFDFLEKYPEDDDRCEPCCEHLPSDPCDEKPGHCVCLAKLTLKDGRLIIDNGHRRPLSRRVPTTIVGINWVHGGQYTMAEAQDRLGDNLRVKFSRPVRKSTLTEGIVEVWRSDEYGRSRGEIKVLPLEIVQPADKTEVDELEIKVKSTDVDREDRILITVRTDFILDKCCQPVDGNHVGGWVPLLPGVRPPEQRDDLEINCPLIPSRLGPRTSGNGIPGGTFESWFYVRND